MPIIQNSFIPPQAIFLDSSQGNSTSSRGDRVSFPLQHPIVIPSNQNAYISLSGFRYSNCFYNVSEGQNKLYYRLSSDFYDETFMIEITPGNYSASTLLERLNTLLGPESFQFTYNPETFRMVVTNSLWGFEFLDGPSSMARYLLGFSLPTPRDVEYTGTYSLNLSGVSYINIGLPSLAITSNGTAGYTQGSTLECVLNDVGLGATKSVDSLGSQKYRINAPVIASIEVVLSGDRGSDLDFHGIPWFLSLSISFSYSNPVRIPQGLLSNFAPLPPPTNQNQPSADESEPSA